ncbi:MAG: cytochrome c-type biogenesis protein CcmH [Alphaproteobacteria bacterium]|nr:cytochrome c-type biogenesis protein CcmH [Alphaproteobacteria bacterium]
MSAARWVIALALLLGAAAAPGPAHAVMPDEILDDPALEARAREISKDVRCLVCQNQSIDDSNAELARDLRLLVRERLEAGDSNVEVKRFLVDRYGQYVLLKPPVNASTILLWAAPALLVGIGLATVFVWFRNRRREALAGGPDETGLSAEERARIDRLLAETDGAPDDRGAEPGPNARERR